MFKLPRLMQTLSMLECIVVRAFVSAAMYGCHSGL
jgi:hypothetical protein